MTGEAETCPFCGTSIPSGVSVCRECGANRGIRGETILPLLFFGALWLFWGPFVGLMGLTHLGDDGGATAASVFGVVITVVGFFPIRWMCRRMVEPVWRRHVA